MAKSKQPSKAKTKPHQAASNLAAPNWQLHADRKSVSATFANNPLMSLKVDVDGIDNLHKTLGELRGRMSPEVEKTLGKNETIAAVANPSWVVRPAPTKGDSLLHLRDPRYGWLHYLIPRAEATKLLAFLQSQLGGSQP